MSDFWKDLGDNIVKGVNVMTDKTGEIVDKIADKTGEAADKSRAKWEGSKLERERKALISDLGELFYLMMRDNALDTDRLQRKCDEITALEERIETLRDGGEIQP